MRDLIEFGKAQRVTFGNFATGSLPQMMAQQLAKTYGLNVEPVFVVQGWMGLLAPANTPPAIVQRLSDLVQKAADTPRVR